MHVSAFHLHSCLCEVFLCVCVCNTVYVCLCVFVCVFVSAFHVHSCLCLCVSVSVCVRSQLSRLGMSDFDFSLYNSSEFAGLEDVGPNSLVNSLLQVGVT